MKLHHYICALLVNLGTLLTGSDALAQNTPSAGSQLQQIALPKVESVPKPDAQIKGNETLPIPLVVGSTAVIAGIRFTGANAITETDLVRISGFTPGLVYDLGELHMMATRVTTHYRSLGYFLAKTYLPSQDITDGVVQFKVIEGQYGIVKLDNQSRLSDAVATNLIASLKDTGAVTAHELERRLLMLSDLPGIRVKSVLAPGADTGTTDISVTITEGQSMGGSLDGDNHGNKYTGANRVGASLFLNEPTGQGDLATARLLSSGDGLSYGQVSYQVQVRWAALGLSYAELRYRLDGEFASLQSSGMARVGSLYVSYPLIRSRDINLNVQLSADKKEFSDVTGSGFSGSNGDKSTQLSTATLRGDFRDAAGRASSDYALTWTNGEIRLHDATTRLTDSLSAQSQGQFNKVNFSLSRLQTLSNSAQIYVNVNGQLASKNLDASEKFSLGGASNVRAFPSGEASGDEGFLLTVESRSNLPKLTEHLSGKLQFIAFLDAGMVNVNKYEWGTDTSPNQRSLRGAGLGLTYLNPQRLMVKAFYAFKLGTEVAQSEPDATGRFWLQLNKSF